MAARIEWQPRDEGSGPGRNQRVAVYGPDETVEEARERRWLLHVAVCRDCEPDDPGCENGLELYKKAHPEQQEEERR